MLGCSPSLDSNSICCSRKKETMNSIALKSPQFAPPHSKNCFWASSIGRRHTSSSFSCVLPFFRMQRLRLRGNSAIVAAAKKENKNINRRKKDDRHSFVPRPDEATGPFPEAVLLKEKKVEEDGRLVPEFADAEERELYKALILQLESDMNVDQMRHYEVVYLIHEDRDEEVGNVNDKIQEFMKEKKGKIWRFSDWGMRRLAYKIQKAKNAHYLLMNFELGAKWINEFKSMLDRDERVIRHLVMKRDKAETQDCPPPEFHTLYGDTYVDYDDDDDDESWDDMDDDDDDDDDDKDDDEEDDDHEDDDEDRDDDEDEDDDDDDDADDDDEDDDDHEDDEEDRDDDDDDDDDDDGDGDGDRETSRDFGRKKQEAQRE